MRILVCGANGQVGREIVDRAPAAGVDVLATTRQTFDITQPRQVESLFERERPELVINAAAFTHVDNAETHSKEAYAINRDGPACLARLCAQADVPLFHLSTDYVFAGDANVPYKESDPTGPTGVYGASKLAGEQRIQAACPHHLILRTSWVYGVHGHNFVKTMLRLGAQRRALSVVADQLGCPTHAGSIADVLLTLARRYREEGRLAWGLYHYSGTPACSWYDFANEIFDQGHAQGLLAVKPSVSPINTDQYPTPARRPAWSVMDCSLFENAFGLQPDDWRSSLASVVAELGRQAAEDRGAPKRSHA